MVRILADTTARFTNPTSPRDFIEVRTVAILAPEGLEPADAIAAAGLAPEDGWDAHKDLPSEGGDALIVATTTAAG